MDVCCPSVASKSTFHVHLHGRSGLLIRGLPSLSATETNPCVKINSGRVFPFGRRQANNPCVKLKSPDQYLSGEDLDHHIQGQGYPYESYWTGLDGVNGQECFESTRDSGRGVVRDTREELWPPVCQQRVDFRKFDPESLLVRSGAHAPLLVWIGFQGRRSEERMTRREQRANQRNCGPASENRSRLMQSQGKGPRPARPGQEQDQPRTRESGKGKNEQGGKFGTRDSGACLEGWPFNGKGGRGRWS